jgi:hypothetical protein
MKTVLGLGIRRSVLCAANHRFIAWLDTDKTYAEGSWSVNDNGRLCFDATWYGVEGHGDATRACFEHRTEDKNINKRALPDGKWFIFSHLPAQPGDEIKSLQLGDQVSENYQKNKAYLAEHKDSIGDEAAKARYLTAKELRCTRAKRGSGTIMVQLTLRLIERLSLGQTMASRRPMPMAHGP